MISYLWIGGISMTEQRTLVLVKPDGVKGQHIGDIITRIEHKGYQITALKVIQATKEQLEAHYEDKVNAPFFPELVSYMQEGPLVGVIVTGTNVVSNFASGVRTNMGLPSFRPVTGSPEK